MNRTPLYMAIAAAAAIAAAIAGAQCQPGSTCAPPTPTIPTRTQMHDGTAWRTLGGCKPLPPGTLRDLIDKFRRKPPTPTPPTPAQTIDFADEAAPAIDQDGENCCQTCAAVQALKTAEQLHGTNTTPHSVGDLYTRINGGKDDGADLAQTLDTLTTTGVCSTATADLFAVTDAHLHGDYAADRTQHKPTAVNFLPDTAAIESELAARRPVIFGTTVTTNFKPNAAGVIGKPAGIPLGGHAIYAVGLRPGPDGNYLHIVNSWGTNWGQNGTAWIHEAWAQPTTYGAWSIASTSADPPPTPPPPPPPPPHLTEPAALPDMLAGLTINPPPYHDANQEKTTGPLRNLIKRFRNRKTTSTPPLFPKLHAATANLKTKLHERRPQHHQTTEE